MNEHITIPEAGPKSPGPHLNTNQSRKALNVMQIKQLNNGNPFKTFNMQQ